MKKNMFILILGLVISISAIYLLSNKAEYFQGQLKKISSTSAAKLKEGIVFSHEADHNLPTIKELSDKRLAEFSKTKTEFSELINSLSKKLESDKKINSSQKAKLTQFINLSKTILKNPKSKNFAAKRREFLETLQSLQGKYSMSINDLLRKITDLTRNNFPIPQGNSAIYDDIPIKKQVYNVAICVPKWSEDVRVNPDEIENILDELDAYYREISFNKARFRLSSLSISQDIYQGDLPMDGLIETDLAIEMCDQDIDFSSTDVFVIYPSTIAGRGNAPKTKGDPGDPPQQTDEGEYNNGIVAIGHYNLEDGLIPHLTVEENFMGRDVLAHEIGHALFDLPHSSTLECFENSYNENLVGCEYFGYGNRFELMSDYSPAGHISGWYKYLADRWINARTVQRTGSYLLSVLETSPDHDNAQLLRITTPEIPVCLDYRKPMGADETFSEQNNQGRFLPGGIPEEGCLFIYLCPGEDFIWEYEDYSSAMPNNSFLLDLLPNSDPDNFYDMWDSCLLEGAIFTDANLDLNISYTSRDEKTIDVQIETLLP